MAQKTGKQPGGPDQVQDDPLMWPFAAARLAMDACFWWMERGPSEPTDSSLPWTTPGSVALELATMRLRDCTTDRSGQPALVCAPYALHRALIADFAPGHSVVQSLQRGGVDRVYLTDWRSATSDMRYLSIDSYLADLNVAIDEIGAPVDLVGLCQGGWLSLLYAARFPAKVRRLVLAGAPVDLSIDSAMSRLARNAPGMVYDQLVARGGGNVSGDEMLRFWSKTPSRDDVATALQRELSDEEGAALLARFDQWNVEPLDLPGTYYLEIVNWIFRENRIAGGDFVALGRKVRLKDVKAPIFLLAGLDDDVVPATQALATAQLVGTPPAFIAAASEPSNHLGLFMGARTHLHAWPRIAEWLRDDLSGVLARSA
ncbi:poly(3-hydroxyalkanoate) synthetase [Bradyrhizobium sacchari]|uniref:Poly(3-hydroxyalkanoate) synthetase n=1 Tax=Bradyrhizobium sacchari TaxID=1399419 RepID=A0A560KKD1_9BRAD|nr:alpha/beta fold hydrolase [Bradyrhizobium sacchari]OPY95625.1 poly(3-hydroxyalkanoate) synthetase [Bradyrhizobium sacchari]TWB66449.1 poly(3-hydroxyalkanoate) synthetase [Bradyrhizobium sacchari]TWB83686.1 poly(3-hydroxyalkanoate) synthetase [Bradyrhizobium sacchari]